MVTNFNLNDAGFFINGILNGNIAALSRAITLVESERTEHRQLASQIIDALLPHTGNSFRLGITGVPGVGKSTFIESFGKEVVANHHKLAVLAIDPSSTKSKGSILGDKTRMETLSVMPQVYIRPSPSSGHLGGITRATYETILLCEAAGFDFIIIETVGVGQSEVAVNSICDFFLLLMLAGAGDELQGIKRGIMEMADALVITKADGNNLEKAKIARAEYAHAMHLLAPPESGWIPRTQICSGLNGTGMKEIYDMVSQYKTFAIGNNYFFDKRKQQQFSLFMENINEELRLRFFSKPEVIEKIDAFKTSKNAQPFSASKQILDDFMKE